MTNNSNLTNDSTPSTQALTGIATQIPVSLEFFPPRDAASKERLKSNAQALVQALDPLCISVTYGAGGSTREGTASTVDLVRSVGCAAVPHISCIGSEAEELIEILDGYKAKGIKRVVALRGDLPSGMGFSDTSLRYASDLVALIRKHYGDWFRITVAAYPETHPQAESPQHDLDYFIQKVQAGASDAITQYFFNADAYFEFINRLQQKGINIPVIPGIMPITNYTQLAHFSQMCGAEIPRWIRLRLQTFANDKQAIREFGHEVIANMLERLLKGGVPSVHFYTLNYSEPVIDLWRHMQSL
ncbi:methylenetetrahydrofolate reductase [NAD(P)H] [Brackiella oedipodis]|uniref:methylenetetrahydrofolate reductase [NAD(P)H] n=1 Tax=Brackiella oedipodis TaxID=124225 RepID=UPI000A02EF7D|nr:methylenetetrahydrofolate reductase [NAD(P)H] [Brackiella oedipodis]